MNNNLVRCDECYYHKFEEEPCLWCAELLVGEVLDFE